MCAAWTLVWRCPNRLTIYYFSALVRNSSLSHTQISISSHFLILTRSLCVCLLEPNFCGLVSSGVYLASISHPFPRLCPPFPLSLPSLKLLSDAITPTSCNVLTGTFSIKKELWLVRVVWFASKLVMLPSGFPPS